MTGMSGQCLCGAVKFTTEGAADEHEACHCRMCRRWGGGPFFASHAGKVTFEGEAALSRYASSEWAERGFCSKCGTHLFYHLLPTDQYIMSVGAFDDADAFKLGGEIFIDNKPAGYAFAGDHPRLTEKETLEKFSAS